MDQYLWYLKQCDLFERLTPGESERLNRRSLMRQYKRNSLIYSPTEVGESVMVLAKGRVKLKGLTGDGHEMILAFIEEGEMFGELAILDGQVRQEYAETTEDSTVVVIPKESLIRLMEARPDIALSLTKLIGLRRQRIENRLQNLLFLSSRSRMVRILLELVASHGDREGIRCVIRLPLSHHDLASLIGVTRETVTIVLGQLQAEGFIEMRRRRIIVLDVSRLEQESQSCPETPPTKFPRRTTPRSPR